MSTSKKRLRPIWLRIHFYLELWLGSVLVVTGITGSLLVFYVEIDQWLNPRIVVQAHGKPQALEAVIDALKAWHPQRGGSWRLEMPLTADRPLTARTGEAHFACVGGRQIRFNGSMISTNSEALSASRSC